MAQQFDSGTDIIVGPATEGIGGVIGEPVIDDPFACLVREGHPRARKTLSLRAYLTLSHVVISPTADGRSAVDRVLAARQLGPRHIVARVPSFLLAPHLIVGTDHVLTAPPRACLRAAAAHLPARVVEAPITLPPLRLSLYCAAQRAQDPRTAWLRGLVGASVREAFANPKVRAR